MAGISKYTAQHTLEYVTLERSLNSIECLKLILPIKEMVCCFVLDGSAWSHTCVVEEASRVGCSYWKRSSAPGQRPMSYHYEHIARNWCVRVPASCQSTIFDGPWHHWTSYIILVWSRIYEENDLIIELRSVMRYKNATDHRHTDTDTQTQTDTQTHRHRHTHTDTHTLTPFFTFTIDLIQPYILLITFKRLPLKPSLINFCHRFGLIT